MTTGIIFLTEDRTMKAFFPSDKDRLVEIIASLQPKSIIYYNGEEYLDVLSEEETPIYEGFRDSLLGPSDAY